MLATLGIPISAGTVAWNAVVFVRLGSIGESATAVQTGCACFAQTAHQMPTTRGQAIHTTPTTVSGSATLDTENMRVSVSFARAESTPLEALVRVKNAKSVTAMHIRVAARAEAALMIENANARQGFRAAAWNAIYVARGSTSLALGSSRKAPAFSVQLAHTRLALAWWT
jgi:hypothetical protein